MKKNVVFLPHVPGFDCGPLVEVASNFGYHHVSVGGLIKANPGPMISMVQRGELVATSRVVELLKPVFGDSENDLLVTGAPANVSQAATLARLFKQAGFKISRFQVGIN